MTHGSLFSGIGGFDLAAEWMGWQNVFHCEWNEFGQKVLKYYWPDAISYNDITKTDFTIHRGSIDILTGGFPCQPYSMAGKRLGKDDERHLWPSMLRAIKEISPRYVVGENVRGLTNWNGGLVFDEVCADLENIGYQVAPFLIPACGTNAPHKRERIWFVAYAKDNGHGRRDQFRQDIGIQERSLHKHQGQRWDAIGPKPERLDEEWTTPDTNDPRTNICMSNKREWEETDGIGGFSQPESWEIGGNGDATDTNSNGRDRRDREHEEQSGQRWQYAQRHLGASDDDGDATNADGIGKRENVGFGYRKSNVIDKISPPRDWETFPTVSPVCDGDDGISDKLDGITFSKWRQESIKAGGNAVVPQVVLQIFRTIEEYEKMNAQ